MVTQGLEGLAEVSTLCPLRTLPHLTNVDPASSVFKDIHRQYTKTLPFEPNFEDFPSHRHFDITTTDSILPQDGSTVILPMAEDPVEGLQTVQQ